MKQIVIILFLIAVFISCKNEKKKHEIMFDFGLENKVIVDSNLIIADTISIYNHHGKFTNTFKFFDYDSINCFLKEDEVFLKLHDITQRFSSADYYIKYSQTNISYNFDSIFKGCYPKDSSISFRRAYKCYFNKNNYNINDTLKCKCYFSISTYFLEFDTVVLKLDSFYYKLIVHPYTKNIHQELLSKFPK